jgi:hypothetical protein
MHVTPTHSLCTQDPFAEKTVYNDGPVDKLFIKLFTQKMADQLEGESAAGADRAGQQHARLTFRNSTAKTQQLWIAAAATVYLLRLLAVRLHAQQLI